MKEERQKSGCVAPLVILVAGLVLGFFVAIFTPSTYDGPVVGAMFFMACMAGWFVVALTKPGPTAYFLQFCASFAVGALVGAMINSR